jgi:hypothetical protein
MRFHRQHKKLKPLVPKLPLPADSKRPSLATLSKDVLRIVTAYVGLSSPDSLRSLTQVSSLFHFLAGQFQRRELRLEPSPENNSELVARCRYLESKASFSDVRHLILVFDSTRCARLGSHSMEEAAVLICSLLPLMLSLKAITHLGDRVPECILAALDNMPHVILSTEAKISTMEDANEDAAKYLLRLCDTSYVQRLDCQITYDETGPLLGIMSVLKQLLLSSRNLCHLALDIAHVQARGLHLGAMGTSEQYCGLGFEAGDKLPALKSLVIKNYPFGRETRKSGSTFDFNTKDYPDRGTEIDFWAREFDWSKLQRLQTAYTSLAVALSDRATSLMEIDTRDCDIKTGPELSYLNTQAALESISIPYLPEDGVTSILRHAATMHEIRIHQPESQHHVWKDQALSPQTLARIQQHCNQLTDLCIDVAREDDWPYEMLDSLGEMRNLKRLELWFELGVANPDRPQQPYLTLSSAKHIFEYLLHARRKHGLQALHRLELHCGDDFQCGSGGGLPTEASFWPLYNSTWFICQLSERDDESVAGEYTVVCPKTQLQKTTGRAADWLPLIKKVQRRVIAFGDTMRGPGLGAVRRNLPKVNSLSEVDEVACHGPKPKKEWHAHY